MNAADGDPGTRESTFARLSDAELVAAIELGHVEAMAEIYERHSHMVRSLASRLCDAADVDQIVQDVFGQLWIAPQPHGPARLSLSDHLASLTSSRAGEPMERLR